MTSQIICGILSILRMYHNHMESMDWIYMITCCGWGAYDKHTIQVAWKGVQFCLTQVTKMMDGEMFMLSYYVHVLSCYCISCDTDIISCQ